jgi:hypothetical protein
MDKDIILYHKDWYGNCQLKSNILIRNNNEKATIQYKKKYIHVDWDNWPSDTFYFVSDQIYIEENYFQHFQLIFLFTKNNYHILLFHKTDFYFLYGNIKNYQIHKFIYFQEQHFIYYLPNVYILEEDKIFYFSLDTYNFNKKITYLLNKSNKKFIDIENHFNCGNYEMDNNILYLHWQNGKTKKFLSNSYHEEINYENIKIIKPISVKIQDKILFSNITLINQKIILTSIYYLYHPWEVDKIKINVNGNVITNQYHLEYNNYECSLMIIIELQNKNSTEEIEIQYEDVYISFQLHELCLPQKNIYAMTLFKDDYQLLKKYLEYYDELGVECFMIYYNDKLNDQFLKEINLINQSNYQIILVEWNYCYWWKHLSNPKHHHAQTMAINDSLYILKNVSDYILYNDLDEYIKIKDTLHDIVQENIDVHVFKCLFCQMGNEMIKYNNFYFEYDEQKIKKGNYWDKFREKNLIKTSSIHLMGIHNVIDQFSEKKLQIKENGLFYHFVNFLEKNRPELMTQYIS